MKKGVVPLLLLIGAFIILGEIIYVKNFIIKTSVLSEVGRENELMVAMDEIEVFKRFLNKIVQFSFCQSGDEDSIKDTMKSYANFYGIKLDFQTLKMERNSIFIDVRIEKVGSFFVIKDEIRGDFEVRCPQSSGVKT